jgi:hypothetical protein
VLSADALARFLYVFLYLASRGWWLDLLCWRCGLTARFDGGSVGRVARQLLGQLRFVVGVELRVVTSARHGHIRQAAIDQLFSCLFGVHVNKYAVGGLPLAAMASDGVARNRDADSL